MKVAKQLISLPPHYYKVNIINPLPMITLREQQTVEKILAEVGEGNIDLDDELEHIIRMGEQQMEAEYEAQAEERITKNRQGINFEQLKQQFDLEEKEETLPPPPPEQQNELDIFERENIRKSKLTEQQIMELDGQLPKLNFTGMLGQQQNIFGLRPSLACRWLGFKKIEPAHIRQAVRCRIGDNEWILLAIGNELVIFMGQVEPLIVSQTNTVTALAVSPCRKYLAIAIQSQLIVYEIRKGNNLILLKNFADLKVANIVKLAFYEGQGPRICFVDQQHRVVIITIELGLILTKVRVEEIMHGLGRVDSCEVTRINNNCVLIAVGGNSSLKLFTIQPQLQSLQTLESGPVVLCLWRHNGGRTQMLLACENRLTLYRLQHYQEENVYYLEEHLLYLNHYPIEQIFLISQFHVLVQSANSYVVVGLPLIPSVMEEPELAQSETAIVFAMAREEGSGIMSAVEEGILVIWANSLQVGQLRGLQQELDQLMVQRSAYREAFSLLVLVSKGMNYSFRFSYAPNDLKRLLYSAIEVAVSTLHPHIDRQIVLFRVGWVVQLCLECREQPLLWSSFYPRLKEKHLEHSLFEMVQIFILKGQLTHIPETIFLDIVSFYAERGKQVVIQNLVLANKQPFEATRLLSLLNQKEMHYLQFYLFSRGILSEQYDFYTPFLRAFTAFTRHQDAHSLKTTESALLCYWILRKTFAFEHVPSGKMTRDTKIVVATEFFVQILARTFVRRLADFNLRLLLEALLIPFLHSEFKDILNEEENAILQKFNDYNSSEIDRSDSDFVGVFLAHLETCLGLNRSSPLWAEFYATVLYLTNSTSKFERIIQILALLFEKRFYRYELRLALGSRPNAAQVKEYLVKLVEEDLMQRQDRLYMKKLLAFEDRQIGYLLHKIDKNYAAALEHYLGNYGPNGLFNFATQIHNEIQKLAEEGTFLPQRKKNELRSFLVRNVGLLFRTDGTAALELFYLIGQTTKNIHELLVHGHYEQRQRLHFLTAVLTKWEHEQFELKEQYMLEHLEEACSLPETEMRSYLDRFYYPLDAAIRVADQRGNYLARAILQTRSGLIEQAFASYQKLVRATLLANREQLQTRTKVSRYIEECVVLCKLYSGEALQQNLWVKLIRFITSFVASQHQYKVYLKVELQRANQNIIAEMLRFLTTTLLISYFTSPQIPLPVHKLLPIHGELFRVVRFDKTNIQRGLLVFKKDLQTLRIAISKENKIAIGLTTTCDFCRSPLAEEERNLAYSCGHSFHRICHDDTSICLTCSYESDSTLIYKAIFVKSEGRKTHPSKTKQKKKAQINQNIYVETMAQARNETRKKRLKLYDFEQHTANHRVYELTNTPFHIDDLLLA